MWWKEDIALDQYNLILIGFSKGCVVLNQFIYEYHYLKTLTPDVSALMVSRITDMYWLDGGHSGGKNTWITSRSLLETLTRLGNCKILPQIYQYINFLGPRIHIHVTPYQIEDDRRPWIKKEEKTFSDSLVKLGAEVHRKVHFADSPPNLFLHFDVLSVFWQESGGESSQ